MPERCCTMSSTLPTSRKRTPCSTSTSIRWPNGARCATGKRCAPLLDAGCEVSTARVVRPDIERLLAETDRSIAREQRSRTLGAVGNLHLDRAATDVLVGALAHGNVIATGEAGSGKSVVLLDAAERLRETGATVVYLSAEADLPTLTTGSIEAVLDAWAEPGRPAYLFIDAMDALRLGNEVRRLRRLIEALARGVAATWAVAVFLANIDSQQRAA